MTPALRDAPVHITTGTITTMLLKKGIRRCWIQGLYPMNDETKARYEAWKKLR
jgi:hypothetical protein